MANTKDLGMVTAYAYAVAGGYTGTEAEFQQLLANLAITLDEFENFSVVVNTLPAGSTATASYADGVLTLGIPKGDTGATGPQGPQGVKGDTGATPALSMGTVTTLPAGSDATASFTGTEEAPVLNLGLPEGADGDVAATNIAAAYDATKTYAVGDHVWYAGALYRCTTAITTAEAWTAAHWTQAALADDVDAYREYNDYKTETIYDSFPHSPATDPSWSVTANTSYQQLVFNASMRKDIKPYIVRLVTDTPISFTRIEFRNTSNAAVANISVNGTATPSEPFYFAINPTGTLPINRIRLYGASNSAIINLDFFDFVAIATVSKSDVEELGYIANLANNKTADLSWINGKYVDANNQGLPRDGEPYAIANFDVKKGDLIKIHYPNSSQLLDKSKGVLSEQIVYGSGTYSYGFRVIYTAQSDVVDYSYIAEKDMSMTVCGKKDNSGAYLPIVEVYSMPAYAVSKDFSAERYLQFEYDETTNKLQIGKASRNGYGGTTYPKPLTLLHYSDVHNNYLNVENIKVFADRFKSFNLDDVICTGDMTGDKFPAYRPIYGLDGYKKILLCIGNHDVYDVNGDAESHGVSYDNEAYWATNEQKYNQYFAPSIAEWGVTQPANAETLGLCYYYKDYSSNGYGYRLIVLDAMAFDDAQYNWLVATLADAKTNSLTVVIADHFAPITGLTNITPFETPFVSKLTGMEYNYSVSRLTATAGSAVNAVDDFINDGGDFACWICGHMHYDQIGTLTNHTNQMFVAVASANISASWLDMPRTKNTKSEDCFNIISIDPLLKVVKIQRIGATIDDWGRVHDHVSVNYQTKELLATS